MEQKRLLRKKMQKNKGTLQQKWEEMKFVAQRWNFEFGVMRFFYFSVIWKKGPSGPRLGV